MERIKQNKLTLISSSIVTLLPMFVGILLWDKLPEQLAIHFDINGNPNQYCSKEMAVFGVSLILLLGHWIIVTIMSKQKPERVPNKVFNCTVWTAPAISLFAGYLCYGNALLMNVDVPFACFIFLGILFLVLGNYLPKVRQNRTTGVRVKWTLESTQNWEHTHRFAGKSMCLCGLLTLILALIKCCTQTDPKPLIIIILLLLVGFLSAPIVYAYLYYKKHNHENNYYNKLSL